jgi:hypothetical protein
MGLRSEPPFRAVVEKKTVSPESFSITLKSAAISRTFTQSPPGADALKVLERLKVGREYDFPKIFDDVLGKQSAKPTPGSTVTSSAQTWQNSVNLPWNSMRLLDLPTAAPFRARVASKSISDDMVSVELHTTDGRKLVVQQSGQPAMKEAKRIASLLQEGETYEFPDDVRTPDAGKKGTTAPTAEMKELEGFVGEWEMPMQTEPDRKLMITYVWKRDGQGLWREIRGEPKSETKKVENAWLITYDAARKCYMEITTRPNLVPREAELHWDPATRTLSSRASTDYPEPGTAQTGSRRLVSEDRMEWHFKAMTPEGRPVNENSGHYTRVRR